MKLIFRYLLKYKKESILAPLFKLLEAFFDLLVPFVIASVIDRGIKGDGGLEYIIKMCLLLLILAAVGLTCTLVAQFFAARAAAGTGAGLRKELFSHIQSLGYSETDSVGTGKLLTAMTNDTNQVQSGVNMTLRLLLRSPIIVFGAMIAGFIIDGRLGLIFTVLIPLLSVIVFGVLALSIPLLRRVQAKLDRVTSAVRTNIRGTRVIRAFNREDAEKASFEEKNNDHIKLLTFAGRIGALTNPVTYVLINLSIVALIYFGGLRVESGNVSQGELIALYNLMSQILVELIKLANTIFLVTRAIASANRVEAILETKTDMEIVPDTEMSEHDGTAVRFSSVSMTYNSSSAPALSNIDFGVNAGETVGIIGGTGSGKTSLVNLIPRFYDATSGKVSVFGRDVRSYDPTTLREMIGIVPQKAVLFEGTVRSNLLWGNENADDMTLIDALKAAQAYDFVMEKEGGLDAHVNQGGSNFSGGQRQRLTIARALVRKPSILILDDSSSALDTATDKKLRVALSSLDFKPTVFIISQRTSSIKNADKIIVLEDGEAVAVGTHKELLENSPVYSEIHNSQFNSDKEPTLAVSTEGGAL